MVNYHKNNSLSGLKKSILSAVKDKVNWLRIIIIIIIFILKTHNFKVEVQYTYKK